MSPIAERAMLQFFKRTAQLRLEKGEPVGRVVDNYLRSVLSLAEERAGIEALVKDSTSQRGVTQA